MLVHEFLRHLAPCEKGKRLILVDGAATPIYDDTFSDDSITDLNRIGAATDNIVLIKTGQTYLKLLCEVKR